ncbi:hypothetical protein CMV_007184 [Castanea mollissima]|uniref:Uncharacterized protein n=1 Tax=Castanea mollissima TaxID=60419 RepID=A0A8J4R9H8_9ROSI|nr:hypothetical protein CMV_007184 [Castanea mollissima]
MKNRDLQRDKFQGSHHRHAIGIVTGGKANLGSNPSLIRGGTTSYSSTLLEPSLAARERRTRKKICRQKVLSLWFACLRKHKLGKIKSSTLLVVVQNTKPKEEQSQGNEYQNLLLYLKSTITIPMSHAAKLVSMSALTIQKLAMQLLSPKYSLLAVTK